MLVSQTEEYAIITDGEKGIAHLESSSQPPTKADASQHHARPASPRTKEQSQAPVSDFWPTPLPQDQTSQPNFVDDNWIFPTDTSGLDAFFMPVSSNWQNDDQSLETLFRLVS